ncbi:MAG TPA: glycosyltransferase family 39 protein [Edaphobacter sp.]|nr:glycosyltransferase family 39 protein [Edaphobacter sp.]
METQQPTTVQADLRSVLWLCFGFAAVKLAIQIVGNILAQHAGYGIFRDELYYLICGRRLAFGYVDQPPLAALQARVSEILFGHETMWSLRLISALAGATKVFLAGLLAWALGGGRKAAALAMLGVIAGGVYLGIDGFLSMNSIDPVFWMLCVLALIRIVQRASQNEARNWWVVFGLSAGMAFENKDSIAFFLVALLVALLLTPQRRILANRWFVVAVALIVFVALPNFLWQVYNHFPTLQWLHDVQNSDKDVKLGPVQFFLAQIMTLTPSNIFLWGTGVLWLLFAKKTQIYRFLGVFYLVFLALMMGLHAKDYYLVPAYPVFFAAGAVALIGWAGTIVWRNVVLAAYALILLIGGVIFFPFSVPVLRPQQWVAYAEKLHFKPRESENHAATPLPQFFADRFGWEDLAKQVSGIYNTLPPEERAKTGILVSNYGQGGAIDILGAKYGLPPAISGHQNYWIWGPRGYTGEDMIVINDASVEEMNAVYRSCIIAGKRDDPYTMPWEHGSIYLCHDRKKSYVADWNELKHYR